MKHIIFKTLTLLLAAVTLTACSKDEEPLTGSIYGKVTDTTGKVISGVTITVTPGGISRTTGYDGTYEINDLDPGQYAIQAQKHGFATNTKTVSVVTGRVASGDMTLAPEQKNADISLSTNSLNFGLTQTQLAVTFTNNGNTSTAWTLDLGYNTWLTASQTSGSIAAHKTQSIILTVDRNKIFETKNVVVNLSAGGNSYPISISCLANGDQGGILSVSPTMLDFGKSSTTKTIEIKNLGEKSLNWNILNLNNDCITVSDLSGYVAPYGTKVVQVTLNRAKLNGSLETSFTVSDGIKEYCITVKAGDTDDSTEEDTITNPAEIVIKQGLSAYYKFVGNCNDASGNMVNGFGYNSPTYVSGVTASSKAIKFSKANNSQMVVSKSIMDTQKMSVSFWGKDFDNGAIFQTVSNGTSEPIFTLTMVNGNLKFVVDRNNNNSWFESNGNFMHPTITDGKWHHVALVIEYYKTGYGNNTTTLYIDGEPVDAVDERIALNDCYGRGLKFILGGKIAWKNHSMDGTNMSVDNFRVYDSTVLSDSDVKAIYDAKQ